MLDMLDGISEADLTEIIQADETRRTDTSMGEAVLAEVRRDPHTASPAVAVDVRDRIAFVAGALRGAGAFLHTR